MRPVNSLDAEIMGNIKKWGNNEEQLAVFEVHPGLNTWRGGVAGGTGQQVYISKALQSQYVKQVSREPLFIDELKWINRR